MPNQPPSPYPRRRSPLLQLDPGLEDQPGGVRPEPSLPPQVAPPVPGVRGGAPELTGVERRAQGLPTLNVRDIQAASPTRPLTKMTETYGPDPSALTKMTETYGPDPSLVPMVETYGPDPNALTKMTEVMPDLRKVARDGQWSADARASYQQASDRIAQQGLYHEGYDKGVSAQAPNSVAVAPPPIFPREMVQQQHPEMVQRVVAMLQTKYDAMTPERRAADPFWNQFSHMPDYAAADMVATMFSNLVAPDRGAQATPMSPAEQAAQRNHPVQRFVDWTNYPNWFRNVGGRT